MAERFLVATHPNVCLVTELKKRPLPRPQATEKGRRRVGRTGMKRNALNGLVERGQKELGGYCGCQGLDLFPGQKMKQSTSRMRENGVPTKSLEN